MKKRNPSHTYWHASSMLSALCILFLSPVPAAQAVETIIQPGQTFTVAGTIEPQPLSVSYTCDGFPAFTPNDAGTVDSCGFPAGTQNFAIWSRDGKNTVGTETNTLPFMGYVNTATTSTLVTTVNSDDGYYESSQGLTGYECWELAARYFKFRWGIDIQTLPSTLAQGLCAPEFGCPDGIPDAEWPSSQYPATLLMTRQPADGTYTPVPGDLIAYDDNANNFHHVGVVKAVNPPPPDGSGATLTVDGLSMPPGYVEIVQENSCTHQAVDVQPIEYLNGKGAGYVHALKNPNSPTSCAVTPTTLAGVGGPYALVSYNTGPAVVMDATGRLVVFVRASDGNIYYKAQLTPNGGGVAAGYGSWDGNWVMLTNPPPPPSGTRLVPSELAMADPVVIPHSGVNATASGAAAAGLDAGTAIIPGGQIDVFYIGLDSNIYHVWQMNNGRVFLSTDNSDDWYTYWSQPAEISTETTPGNINTQIAPVSQISLLGTGQLMMAAAGTVMFYVDQYETIYELTSSAATAANWSPTATYTWTVPKAITGKTVAGSNITAVISPNLQPYLFFAGMDQSVQTMFNSGTTGALGTSWTGPIQVGTGSTASSTSDAGLAAAAGGTVASVSAGTGPGSVHSEVSAQLDPSGGLAVVWRGSDGEIWEAPPTPNPGGLSERVNPWDGTWMAPYHLHGKVSSDVTISMGFNGPTYIQLFARSDDEIALSVKQIADPTMPGGVRWDKHHPPIIPASVSTTGTGLHLLPERVFSVIAQAFDIDLRNEIFYIDYLGNVQHLWQLKTPIVDPSVYTVNGVYPAWSSLDNLGSPLISQVGAGALLGWNTYCQYIQNGIDGYTMKMITAYEGSINGCYCDPIEGCGFVTWGIGILAQTAGQNSCTAGGITYPVVCPTSTTGTFEACGEQPDGTTSSTACGVPAVDFPQCAQNEMAKIAQAYMQDAQNDGILCTVQLTQNQYDALADLFYQTGPDDTDVIAALNATAGQGPAANFQPVVAAIMAHDQPTQLYCRRYAEALLFCEGTPTPNCGPDVTVTYGLNPFTGQECPGPPPDAPDGP